MKAFVVLMSAVALSSPAFAQDAVSVVSDRGADTALGDSRHSGESDAQGERLICRSISTSSTSRMSARRVCRTATQWREISRGSGN